MVKSKVSPKAPKLKDFLRVTKPSRLVWWLTSLASLGLATGLFLVYSGLFNQPLTDVQIIGSTPPPPEPQPTSLEGRYLMTGTIVLDRGVEAWSRNEAGYISPAQPVAKLATYQPEQYDAWFTDLECPVSRKDLPEAAGRDLLQFNCQPLYLPALRSYFEFINLSNNHSSDGGPDKLAETRQLLDLQGFQAFGDPDPSQTDQTCKVVGLPVRLVYPNKVENLRLPVAVCAWHYIFRLPKPGEIEVMRDYAQYMPVFAFLHMGAEYQPQADYYQQQVAQKIIDQGADLVVANNPHWVQNAEVYKDKLIIYSTGNFIFDQMRNRELQISVSLDVSLELDYDQNLDSWLELGQTCLAAQDCLEQAKSLKLEPLRPDYSFDVIAGDIQSRQQTKGDSEVQAFVRQRLGWENLKINKQ